MRIDPAVAKIRTAVRRELADLEPGSLVLVACSGGADSLALATAAAFVAPRASLRAGAVTIDHQLQPDSAVQASRVVDAAKALGLDPVESIRVRVGTRGGPEAAARRARYRAIDQVADRLDAAVVLLGHTRDDQAETVLLGLARGSGARSIAGMPRQAGRYRRPLLSISRTTTRAACVALGLEVCDDQQNADPVFTRNRVREAVLPAIEASLGERAIEALARTADLLRADADALDAWATQALAEARAADGLDIARLGALPAAIRTRVLRIAALDAGALAGSVTARHVAALDAFVVDWHGQGPVALPGRVVARRQSGRLLFVAAGSKDR